MASQSFIKCVVLTVSFIKSFLFESGAVILGLIGFDFFSVTIEPRVRPWDQDLNLAFRLVDLNLDLRPMDLDLMISESVDLDLDLPWRKRIYSLTYHYGLDYISGGWRCERYKLCQSLPKILICY